MRRQTGGLQLAKYLLTTTNYSPGASLPFLAVLRFRQMNVYCAAGEKTGRQMGFLEPFLLHLPLNTKHLLSSPANRCARKLNSPNLPTYLLRWRRAGIAEGDAHFCFQTFVFGVDSPCALLLYLVRLISRATLDVWSFVSGSPLSIQTSDFKYPVLSLPLYI